MVLRRGRNFNLAYSARASQARPRGADLALTSRIHRAQGVQGCLEARADRASENRERFNVGPGRQLSVDSFVERRDGRRMRVVASRITEPARRIEYNQYRGSFQSEAAGEFLSGDCGKREPGALCCFPLVGVRADEQDRLLGAWKWTARDQMGE